jgi:hypothetical protein
VYKPEELIVPVAAVPPATLFTIQTVFPEMLPLNVALNCAVWAGKRTAVAGVMVVTGSPVILPLLHPAIERRSKQQLRKCIDRLPIYNVDTPNSN